MSTSPTNVPHVVIGRLPIYLRALKSLSDSGQQFTSSQELGKRLGIGSAQIRRDLAHFGEFGKQGTGYEVGYLYQQICKILNVDREWSVALVGFGDLGQALIHYGGFARRGYHISVIFDNDPAKIGQQYNDAMVHSFVDASHIIAEHNIKIGIIAVPATSAQEVVNVITKAGIKALLNYAPTTLFVPENVRVEYIDPIAHLQQMSYYLD